MPARISAQTGRLTNSTHRHAGPWDSAPPGNTPAAAARPEIVPQTPSARLRSSPELRLVVRIDSPAGAIIAAPPPEQVTGPAAEQQLPAAGDQQRSGLGGHEMSLQNWTDQYSPEASSKWTI